MGTCEVCGNDYDKAMTIEKEGATHVFDSFECAIHGSPPPARTATAGSSATATRPAARCSAVRTAPGTTASRA